MTEAPCSGASPGEGGRQGPGEKDGERVSPRARSEEGVVQPDSERVLAKVVQPTLVQPNYIKLLYLLHEYSRSYCECERSP